jgi:redox-sensitive bicupin YhaK (pirin superfamily)
VDDQDERADLPSIPVANSHEAMVGGTPVRRALPQRERRTVGAWCFADHIGPVDVSNPDDAGIGPHPHIGLQTVTWLIDGELRHRDSLGSDQVIRPGQHNLMTAGNGAAHAEEWHAARGRYHGIQLWVAQPDATRHGDPAFEHHAELPLVDLDAGTASVLVGALDGQVSPARHDTDHLGYDLALRAGTTVVPLAPSSEHALIVLDGRVEIGSTVLTPGHLGYLAPGRDEVPLAVVGTARAMLIGGAPFEARVSMWWNFVGREHDELTIAQQDWNAGAERFGTVTSVLDRIDAPSVPWHT